MRKIFILFLLLSTHVTYAQNVISGTIKDKDTNEGLIGANVVVKNSTNGTATNLNGFFQITSSKSFLSL